MNILILSSKFPYPLKDGGAIATYNLARGLADTGNKVHILSFNTNKHYIKKSELPSKEFEGIEIELVDIDTSILFFKAFTNLLFSRRPYIMQRFKSDNYRSRLESIMKMNTYNIVQVEGLYMMQYANDIKSISKARIAYRPHNLEHRIWSLLADNSGNFFKKTYLEILSGRIFRYERSIINSYDAIVPISPHDASYFEKLGNVKPLAVIPTGFNVRTCHFADKPVSKHRLFYIGSLEWLPNQEGITWFINKCWENLHKLFPELELHIAGRNTPEWLVKNYSRPGIYWAGEVDDVKNFVRDKSIMIVPLFSGSGLRIKIIEAFLNQKAVVATPVAVEGTGAADNVELCVADGHVEFISKIKNLIRNEKVFQNILRNSFAFAIENFDNQKISADISKFYQEIRSANYLEANS